MQLKISPKIPYSVETIIFLGLASAITYLATGIPPGWFLLPMGILAALFGWLGLASAVMYVGELRVKRVERDVRLEKAKADLLRMQRAHPEEHDGGADHHKPRDDPE